jgi:hypothetical protein
VNGTASGGVHSSSALPSPKSSTSPPPAPKRWAQDDGREYPISTERAEAISRWVREAPLISEGNASKRGRRKGKRKVAEDVGREAGTGLEGSVDTLCLASQEEVE